MDIKDITIKNIKELSYDEIYYLYITLNYSYEKIRQLFNLNTNSQIRDLVAKYNIKKSKQLSSQASISSREDNYEVNHNNHIERYKESHNGLTPDEVKKEKNKSTDNRTHKEKCQNTWRNKTNKEDINNKRKQTMISKYGADNPMLVDEFKNKLKETNINKYGVDCVLKSDDIKEKIANTNKIKYGYSSATKNIIVKNKIKETNLNKYGFTSPLLDSEKIKLSMLNKYGVTNASQLEFVKNKVHKKRINYLNTLYSREEWQSDIFDNKDKFIKCITEMNNPTILDISKYLSYDECSISKKILEYNCQELVQYRMFSSRYEDEIIEYINSLGITNIVRHERDILNGKEIDIYLPDYKFGIEFNGDYWHSEFKVPQKFHQDKSLLAESKGVFLYHIFEHEWLVDDKKDKIKYQIQNILLHNSEKIYARKCTIGIVDKKEKRDFINKNHIQGDSPSTIDIGLFYEDKLVSIMTFGVPRFNKKVNYELIRYCSERDINVIGGASKIFKHFVDNYMKDNEIIISYSDITKTRGNIYSTLGFINTNIEYPNYVWCNMRNETDIIPRYRTMIKNEIDTMHQKKYYRVFDAGIKVWKYKKGN